jgi:hypothetical protein
MPEQTTLPPAMKVTGPGVYDLTAEVYHADPVPGGSLSSTGVRKLLPPSCPARFQYDREHPEPTRKVWEIGSAAHKLVLGVGPELVRIDAAEWRSNAVKAEVEAVREAGGIPLKPGEYDAVHGMAEALRAHPFAGKLFEPGTGKAEQALVWLERAAIVNPEPLSEGEMVTVPVRCRALLDWLPNPTGGRLIIPDYKSCVSAAPAKAERAMADHGYHIQLRFYRRAVLALGLAGEDARGVLVMQEKTPPYLVTVIEPDQTASRMADLRIREALDIYAECTATGRWPGYSDDVVLAELPPWETRELNGEVW